MAQGGKSSRVQEVQEFKAPALSPPLREGLGEGLLWEGQGWGRQGEKLIVIVMNGWVFTPPLPLPSEGRGMAGALRVIREKSMVLCPWAGARGKQGASPLPSITGGAGGGSFSPPLREGLGEGLLWEGLGVGLEGLLGEGLSFFSIFYLNIL